MTNEAILKDAIKNKLQVTGYCEGFYREFCPHAIGWKHPKDSNEAHYNVSVYQFGGTSSKGPIHGSWKCWRVDSLSRLASRPGPWHSEPVTRGTTCIDKGRAEVQAY